MAKVEDNAGYDEEFGLTLNPGAIDSRIVPTSSPNPVAELACATRPWSTLQGMVGCCVRVLLYTSVGDQGLGCEIRARESNSEPFSI